MVYHCTRPARLEHSGAQLGTHIQASRARVLHKHQVEAARPVMSDPGRIPAGLGPPTGLRTGDDDQDAPWSSPVSPRWVTRGTFLGSSVSGRPAGSNPASGGSIPSDPAMLACRGCRRPLEAQDGCVLCQDIKRHLVALDEDSDERASIAEVSSDVITALRHALRPLKAKIKESPEDDTLVTQVLRVGNTTAKVLEAARKLQADGLSVIKNMSFVERAELFVTWYTQLPPPHRARLREKMEEFETQVSTPKELPE